MLLFFFVFCLLAAVISVYIGKEKVFYLGDGIIHSSAIFVLAGSFIANANANFLLMMLYCILVSGFLMLIKDSEDKTASLCLFAYFSLVVASFITQFTQSIDVHDLIESYFLGSNQHARLPVIVMSAIFCLLFVAMFIDNILEKPSKAKILHSKPINFMINFLISFSILIMSKEVGFLMTSCFTVAPFVFGRFFTNCNKRTFLIGLILNLSSLVVGVVIADYKNLLPNITICFAMFVIFSFGLLIKGATLIGCRECKDS